MIELFINDHKADIDDSVRISLTYNATDLENPTNVRNSYSKTISLKGTANNNRIFDSFFMLDHSIGDFDPRKRVEAVIYDNSSIVEKGYIKLDSIKRSGNSIVYNITFYGSVGDFFYSLSFNEDGSKKIMSDLNFNLNTPNSDKMLEWTTDYILGGWDKLTRPFDETDRTPDNWIIAAPTYSGMYEDFDNEKILINQDSYKGGEYSRYHEVLPDTKTVDGKIYRPKNGWVKCEAPRELVEAETHCMVSKYQRPAVKLKLIMDAISNPQNNGGYQIVWPEDSTDPTSYYSKYLNKSYVLMNRIPFDEEIDTANSYEEMRMKSEEEVTKWIPTKTFSLVNLDGNETIDISNMVNPTVSVAVQPTIPFAKGVTPDDAYTFYTSRYDGMLVASESNWYYGGIHCRVDVYDGDGKIVKFGKDYILWSGLPRFIYGDKKDEFDFGYGYDGDIKQLVASKLGLNRNNIEFVQTSFKNGKIANQPYHTLDRPFVINIPNVSADSINVKITFGYVSVEKSNPYAMDYNWYYFYQMANGVVDRFYTISKINMNVVTNSETKIITGIFNSSISPLLQHTIVNPQMLFGNEHTPLDYLLGWLKIFGDKVEIDSFEKKAYIRHRWEYYKDLLIDIDKDICRDKEIVIQPTYTDAKWYEYGLGVPQTYASQIYMSKVNGQYGKYRQDTEYSFNNETRDMYDGNIYQNVIPYRLSSIYMPSPQEVGGDTNVIYPLFSQTVRMTYFNNDDENEQVVYTPFANDNARKRYYDRFNFLCCFDKDNGNVDDISNAIVLLDDNISTSLLPYTMCDILPVMSELNNGKNCYISTADEMGYASVYDTAKTKIASKVYTMPSFNTDLNITYDFAQPAYNWLVNGYTQHTLYSLYWDRYIADLYEKNNKTVELWCFLHHEPREAMKRCYYFDGSYWVIISISDYVPSMNGPVKVKFVKTNDYVNNYLGYPNFQSVNFSVRLESTSAMTKNK